MAELVYRQPCAECGSTGYLHEYDHPDSTSLITRSQCHVCGGSGRVEQVLAPDKVLFEAVDDIEGHDLIVADVLEVLDQEEGSET